jgi:putative nucleotidyltransferase with HDIG domain
MSTVRLESQDLAELFGSPKWHDCTTLADRIRVLDEPLYVHAGIVAAMAKAVADRIALDECDRTPLIEAAWLHDIGKLTVSRSILEKPAALDAAEWTEMRAHSVRGADFLASNESIRVAARLVRHHHERFEGVGYPAGLAGNAIPLGSRIIAIVDAYDAMTTNRPYRHAISPGAALEELRRCAGTQFDPVIVDAFRSIHPLLEKGLAS